MRNKPFLTFRIGGAANSNPTFFYLFSNKTYVDPLLLIVSFSLRRREDFVNFISYVCLLLWLFKSCCMCGGGGWWYCILFIIYIVIYLLYSSLYGGWGLVVLGLFSLFLCSVFTAQQHTDPQMFMKLQVMLNSYSCIIKN